MAKIIMATHNHYTQIYKVGDSHLAENFVKRGHDVLYISGPFNIFRIRHLFQRGVVAAEQRNIFKTWFRGGIRYNDKLLEYSPLSLLPISNHIPFGKSRFAMFKNVTLTFPSLRRYIQKKGFGNPDLLIVSQLQLAELLECVNAKVKILRLTDEVTKFENVPENMSLLEEWALKKADYVLVTSKPLQDRLSKLKKSIKYIPNAVDYDFYSSADKGIPLEYLKMKGQKAVYVGAIDSWFDIDLVVFLAEKKTDVNFIFIGNSRIAIDKLRQHKNIHLLGVRPYTELAKYLWNADIGIIPFKRIPLVEAVSPLKLYEYLACGLPVVSTRWEELEKINSPAFLAETPEDFTRKLSDALACTHDKDYVNKCRNFAKENSWKNRAEQILDLAGMVSVG